MLCVITIAHMSFCSINMNGGRVMGPRAARPLARALSNKTRENGRRGDARRATADARGRETADAHGHGTGHGRRAHAQTLVAGSRRPRPFSIPYMLVLYTLRRSGRLPILVLLWGSGTGEAGSGP